MSIKKTDREFWDICDSFIELANKQSSTFDYEKVSAAFLHAAARFNSFSVWAGAEDIAEFKSEKDVARDNFSNEYKKIFAENLDDYEANFDKYRRENKL